MQKFRWSRVYESSEEELLELFKARKLTSERLVAAADSDASEHRADRDTTLWCGEGSLTVRTDSTSTALQPGDALRIDGHTAYSIRTGIAGHICYLTR